MGKAISLWSLFCYISSLNLKFLHLRCKNMNILCDTENIRHSGFLLYERKLGCKKTNLICSGQLPVVHPKKLRAEFGIV